MVKNISLIIIALASIIFVGLTFYGLNIKKSELNNSIRFTCGELYRYTETLANGAVTSYPMEKEYKDCLKGD